MPGKSKPSGATAVPEFRPEMASEVTDRLKILIVEWRQALKTAPPNPNPVNIDLPREIRDAVSSNARSRLVFQCGQDDATYLAREFAPLDATALMSLPRFEMAARLSIAGQTSRPFTMRTHPPLAAVPGLSADEIRASSLARFGRDAVEVDRELKATFEPTVVQPRAPVGVRRRQSGQ